jgi:phenylacetate-CoA ligase
MERRNSRYIKAMAPEEFKLGANMNGLFGKIQLGLKTYQQGYLAIARQSRPAEIKRIQDSKLQSLIRYSFEKIKYYRELFTQHDIRPEQIRTADDLHRIPILTKQQLREQFWDFLPRELPECRVSRTSGSTGVPICIFSDKNSRMYNSAAVIRYRQALGIGLVGKTILTPLKTANEPYNKKPHWTFLQGIHKTYYINPYVDSVKNADYAKRLLNKLNSPAIIGITPAVRALACKVKDGVFPYFQPSVILTTGESLSTQVRDLLEATFEAKVADIYACNEAGDVAWQCQHSTGYHINADNVIVEIVRNNEPVEDDQIGEVVITNLNRYSMPIIRYRDGDLARLTKELCPCGCKLPMIAGILGRTGEDIFLPDGGTVSWNQLKSPMNHPQIRQFQIIQNENGNLTIRYVAEAGANTKQIESLLLVRYRGMLGSSIDIEMDKTNEIAPAPSGKSKLVISNYKPAQSPAHSTVFQEIHEGSPHSI